MVGEAQRLLDESKSRADHFEGLSKEICFQACQQVQQLMTIAQQLHQSCIDKDESLQKLSFEFQMVEAQLQGQISNNQDVLTQFESAKSQTQRLFGHNDSRFPGWCPNCQVWILPKLGLIRDWLLWAPLKLLSKFQLRHRGIPAMSSHRAFRWIPRNPGPFVGSVTTVLVAETWTFSDSFSVLLLI